MISSARLKGHTEGGCDLHEVWGIGRWRAAWLLPTVSLKECLGGARAEEDYGEAK